MKLIFAKFIAGIFLGLLLCHVSLVLNDIGVSRFELKSSFIYKMPLVSGYL